MNLLLLLPLFALLFGFVLRTKEDPDPDAEADAPEDDKEKPEDIYDLDPDADDESGDETETPGDADAPGSDEEEEGSDDLSGFDTDLVDQARNLGLVDSEINGFGSDAALRRSLAILKSRAPAATDDVADDAGSATTDVQEGESDARGGDDTYTPFEVTLSEDDYDSNIVGTIKGMNEHYGQVAEAQQAKIDDLVAKDEARDAAVFESYFDSAVESLGPDFESLLGKGPGREFSKDSTERQNRAKIVTQMNTIDAGRRNNGLPELSEPKVFEQAVRTVFGNEQVNFAKREMRNQARRRKSKIGARPTNRSGAAEDRIEVAGARVLAAQEAAGSGDPEADDQF